MRHIHYLMIGGRKKYNPIGNTLRGLMESMHKENKHIFLMTGTENTNMDYLLDGMKYIIYDRLKSGFSVNTIFYPIYNAIDKTEFIPQIVKMVDKIMMKDKLAKIIVNINDKDIIKKLVGHYYKEKGEVVGGIFRVEKKDNND